MEQFERIEYELLNMAVKATDPDGAPAQLTPLWQRMTQFYPTAELADVVDACKRLFPDVLSLRKYEQGLQNFRDYQGAHNDEEFFYRGDFRLKRTEHSRPYLERLASLLPPSEGNKNPIGFRP